MSAGARGRRAAGRVERHGCLLWRVWLRVGLNVVSGLEFEMMRATFGGGTIRMTAPIRHPSRCFTGCIFGGRGVFGCLPDGICGTLVSTVSGNTPLSHDVTSRMTTNVGG